MSMPACLNRSLMNHAIADSRIPLASAFCPSSITRRGVFCPQLRRKRDVPKSRIIATGSTGAIGGH